MINLIIYTLLTATIIYIIYRFWKDIRLYNELKRISMSFFDSLSLTNMPIVTFCCGENKINLIIDTGSNNNIIDNNILDKINATKLNKTTYLTGIEGGNSLASFYKTTLQYKDTFYDIDFIANDCSAAFNVIKSSYGIEVHGLLGNKFFKKYKYIIDFDQCIIYSKNKK